MTNQATKNVALIKELEIILASSYSLYLKTQNYHWNVMGPAFRSMHLLFEENYTDLAAAIDIIAERMRMLGAKVNGTFKAFEAVSLIAPAELNISIAEMLKQLLADQQKLVHKIQEVLNLANKTADTVTADILTARLTVHEKNIWMLTSSLQ